MGRLLMYDILVNAEEGVDEREKEEGRLGYWNEG